MTNTTTSGNAASRTTLALGLSVVGALLYVVAMFVAGEDGSNEWMWPVAGVLGLAGAIMGWMAGKPRPQGRALAAVVLGGLTAVIIIGWIVWAAATGNM